jgi:hypothetical protein
MDKSLFLAFEFGNVYISITIVSTDRSVLDRLARSYQAYQTAPGSQANPIVITLQHNSAGYCLEAPWGKLDIPEDAGLPLPNPGGETTRPLGAKLEQALLRGLCFAWPDLDCFHAAAVDFGGRCVALAGLPFTGKSTLALALCALGGRLVTDDVLLAQAGRAWSLRRRTAFRPNSALFSLEDFADPDTRIEGRHAHFTALVNAPYLAENGRAFPLTDIFLLQSFQPETCIQALAPFAGLSSLSQFSFLPLEIERPGKRLLRYASSFERVHWWTCAPGSPLDAAQRIIDHLKLPGSAS